MASIPITRGAGDNVRVFLMDNGDAVQAMALVDSETGVPAPVTSDGVGVKILSSLVEQNLEIKNLGGNTIYSNVSNDFLAAPATGTKNIVISSFASGSPLAAALTTGSVALGHVLRKTTSGAVTAVPLSAITFNTTDTFTFGDMTENFTAGDEVYVTLIGPDKGYDTTTNFFQVKNNEPIAGEDTTVNTLRTTFYPVKGDAYAPQNGDNTYATRVTKKLENAGAGNVYSVQVFNFGSSLAYFQLHDKATAPIATDVPKSGCVWPVPAGTATQPGSLSLDIKDFAPSVYHLLGIGWALSSTLATFTDALTATDFIVNIRRI